MAGPKQDTGTWDVVNGINYPPGDKRKEAGEKVDDLMPASVGAFLTMGDIVPRDARAKQLAAEHEEG